MVTAQKMKTQKTGPWLSSSRNERRVLQRRRQPTPTQPMNIYIHIPGTRVYTIGVGGYSFDACFSNLTFGHASLRRRSTVPTSTRDNSNSWALITSFPYIRFFAILRGLGVNVGTVSCGLVVMCSSGLLMW